MHVLISLAIAALGMAIMKRYSALVGLVILVSGVIGVLSGIPGGIDFVENLVTAAGSAATTFLDEAVN